MATGNLTRSKLPRPVLEGAVLFVGILLAAILPMVVVPLAIIIALATHALNKARKLNPTIPTMRELLEQQRVVVTTRVVLLLLFGTLPLMIAKDHLWAIAVMLIYNIVIFVLVIADVLLSPRPDKLLVERRVPGKLSIAQPNRVELVLTNQSYSAIELELIDEFPEEFKGEGRQIELRLEKRTSATISYEIVPLQRGAFYFNRTVVRFRGLLELVVFQEAYGDVTRVEVYPDITSISKFDLLMKRSHLMEIGLISERRRGSGTDFESLREYIKGDEFRKIDWKASARRNKLITREFQSEVNQSIMVLLDCSRSMGAQIDEITLLDHAVNGALLLGHQVLRKGDKIGLITFSDTPHQMLPPGRGKNHFFTFVRNLYAVQANRVEPDFVAVMKALTMTTLRRSMLMIVTDLTSGEAVDKMLAAIPVVSRKHLPVIVSVLDPRLKKAAMAVPNSSEEVYQKVVARNLIARVSNMARKIEQMGVATVIITPEELSSSLLSQYLKAKLRSRL